MANARGPEKLGHAIVSPTVGLHRTNARGPEKLGLEFLHAVVVLEGP